MGIALFGNIAANAFVCPALYCDAVISNEIAVIVYIEQVSSVMLRIKKVYRPLDPVHLRSSKSKHSIQLQ